MLYLLLSICLIHFCNGWGVVHRIEDVGKCDGSVYVDPTVLDSTLRGARINESDICWKTTSIRGKGSPPTFCGEMELEGNVCFPKCKDGHIGRGNVCWKSCEEGFEDHGPFCIDGNGVSHRKLSYNRGFGRPPTCSGDQDTGVVGRKREVICYPKCEIGTDGIGPACWNHCSGSHSINGGAFCCTDARACRKKIIEMGSKLPIEVARAVYEGADPFKLIADVHQAVGNVFSFVLPLCNIDQ